MSKEVKYIDWDNSAKSLAKLLDNKFREPGFANSAFVRGGMWTVKRILMHSIIEKRKFILNKYCCNRRGKIELFPDEKRH
jgi:hypothetical protein